MKEATIIGGGLAGALQAIYLAKRGYRIKLYESRPDVRIVNNDGGRSINLALSCRGLTGLLGVGLHDQVHKRMAPMKARAIHEENGEIIYQSFGRHENEYINAIERSELNKLLLNELEQFPNVTCYFEVKLIDIDFVHQTLSLENKLGERINQSYMHLIGADGAGSIVRELLSQAQLIQFTRTFLPHGYKELSIGAPLQSNFAVEHLHLWPRNSFLLLGNPNIDQSITGSLFLPHQGKNSFAELNNEFKINHFFKDKFTDAYPVMPDLIDEFMNHPTGNMSTIKCFPWHYQGQCLLIGDAAHGVIPFFGQGMNSAFEDCRIFNQLLDKYDDNWTAVLPAFNQERKPNTDAVAEMSMSNYREIQTDILDKQFNLKKQLEQLLMQHYPETYISKHVMVMFTNTPYSKAQAIGNIQNEFLNRLCIDISSLEEINWKIVDKFIKNYDKKLAKIN